MELVPVFGVLPELWEVHPGAPSLLPKEESHWVSKHGQHFLPSWNLDILKTHSHALFTCS